VKAGRIASLSLWLIITAIAAGGAAITTWLPELSVLPDTTRAWIIAAVLASGAAAVLLPFGIAMDRAIGRLGDYIRGAAEEEQGGYAAPRWLLPVTRAVTGAVDHFQQREQTLKNQLRDLEIRHRVSEAQRCQIEEVLHSLRDGVVVTDAFNEIVMANEAAARTLAFELEEATHRQIDKVVRDGRVPRLIMDCRDNANFSDRRHVEYEIDGGIDGSGKPRSRVFDVSLTCVENHNSEVSGVVTILHDLTREREVSQMKSDFVSKASHELRTPLSSIRAYVEMLVDDEADDEEARQEFYKIIQGETDRLGRLIDNMLNISRIEAGIVQIERENVDLKPLVGRALDALEPQAREKKISLHQKLVPVDLCVEGDSDMLYQVILNLVSNGVKYTPEGGRITVSADSDNLTRSVVVTVADTGLGISPDDLPKLFEKFYRVENYKRVAKGTGLGLNLCRHIVETVHRGQIGVESQLGMGSRFWFSIPMQYAGSQAAA
jgi:two-component system phosphate regulon sensor histidine kinase PhoR